MDCCPAKSELWQKFRKWIICRNDESQFGDESTSHRCALRWRHNDHAGVSNHQPHGCLLNRLFRRKSKKTSKLRVTGLCAGNSPGTGEFPAQMASYAENVSIWWRHHGLIWRIIYRIINLSKLFGLNFPVHRETSQVFHLDKTSQWRHSERDGVTNHRRLDCLLKRYFRRRSKKTSKLCVTGLCEGTGDRWIAPESGSNAENCSIWLRHHIFDVMMLYTMVLCVPSNIVAR